MIDKFIVAAVKADDTADSGGKGASSKDATPKDPILGAFDPQLFLLKEEETQDLSSTPDTMSDKEVEEVIQGIMKTYKVEYPFAWVIVSKLIQMGGTNASKPTLILKLSGISVDINELRRIIKLVNKKGTVRKFAKSARDKINRIAVMNNWSGPLYKDLIRLEPGLNIPSDEAPYCSEINSDNYQPEIPARVREALQRREFKLRENYIRAVAKQKSNPGKKNKKSK